MSIKHKDFKDAITLDEKEVAKLKDFLSKKPKVLILTHANPDGDAIGSALGWYLTLKKIGITVDVVDIDGVPEYLQFIPGSDAMKTEFTPSDYDGIFFLDCGDKKMTRFNDQYPEILTEKTYKINIDHHPSNDNFGEINFVITNAASTTQILVHIIRALEIKIDPMIASCLLVGLYTDTGGFMHQNTTPSAFRDAASLVREGGNVSKISSNVFRKNEFKTLKLWGRVLQNLHVTPDGAAIVGIEREQYESLGATRSDLAGVIDYINSMPEAEYCVLLSEDEKGNVKASLRTRKEDVDMKALAEKFGGGGHIKASGFTVPKSKLQKQIKWKIVKEED